MGGGLSNFTTFTECTNFINTLDNFNTSSVWRVMLKQNLSSVILADIFKNLPNITSFYGLFKNNTALRSVKLGEGYNTTNVTDFRRCFWGCTGFNNTTLDLSDWDVSSGKDFYQIFSGVLPSVINMSNWDMRKCTSMYLFFWYTAKLFILNNIKLPNIDLNNIGLYLTDLPLDQIVLLLEGLPETSKGYKVNIGTKNLNKLTEDLIAIATSKGWTVV